MAARTPRTQPARVHDPHAFECQRGTTLAELVAVLVIAAVLLSIAAPPLGRMLDQQRTRAAQSAAAAALARVRALAIERGGAALVLALPAAQLWIESRTGDTLVAPVDLAREYGVAVRVDGVDSAQVRFEFDALGLGRMANRTVRFQRGGAEARLTLSSYGRVRRW